jgi:digeranylgeranylglycerophospholipid reductase
MTDLYDVIIVGAGPGGAMAAKVAGENGLKAALIERKTDLSTIHRICTMIINIDEENFGEYITYNYRNKRFVFPHNGFSIKYDGPMRKIYGFHIISPCGNRFRLGDVAKGKTGEVPTVGLMIDKGHLNQSMVDEAKSHGVEVFNNTNINNVRKEPDCVVLTDNWGNEYRGKFVIAADGVNSRIARKLGFNKERIFLGTYKDMARTYEDAEVPEADVLMFCMGWKTSISIAPELPDGHFHVSAASYNVNANLNEEIDRFLSSEPYVSWFKNAREIVDHRGSCVSNIASPIQVPFKDNVLLVGDAGWMQETSITGAILPGWSAANAVTEALIKKQLTKEGVSTYLTWWDKYLYQPHGKRLASSGGAEIKDYLSPEDIDYLVSLAPDTLPGTMNFFIIMRSIGKTFSVLLQRIQEERPDIMQKLMAMRSFPKELALARRRNEGCAIIS